MARTLVIDSIEAVGRTFKSGEKLFIDPKLKKFMVNFRRPSGYQGKYGFDWLRDEYIYPIETVANDNDGTPIGRKTPLCKNFSALKTEYKTKDIVNQISPYGNDYYPAWVSIFPHTTSKEFEHGSNMHKNGIDLNLEIEELESLIADGTTLSFFCSNSLVKITPEKLKLKDLIGAVKVKDLGAGRSRHYHLTKNIINIRFKGGASGINEEIRVFAELNEVKEEVGKLMIYKNKIIPKAEIVVVNVIIGSSTSNLRNDYQYIFKNQSFNQSLIRADVDVETSFNINNLPKTDNKVTDFISNYSSDTFTTGKDSETFTKELIELYDTYGKHKPNINKIDHSSNKRTYLFLRTFIWQSIYNSF